MTKHFLLVAAATVLAALAFGQGRSGNNARSDMTTTDLKDGYVRVVTSSYTIEVPKGWVVSSETPWGARDIRGNDGASMSTMTANASGSTWDRLYNTSLFFIRREMKGEATPYKLSKSAQGYEAMSFSILDESGFAKARYVILKHPSGAALALSVKIPGKQREKELATAFDRLVRTAKIVGQ